MTLPNAHLPEPLLDFSRVEPLLSPQITELAARAIELNERRNRGSVLPNTIEAARIEYTYHSNAIEGSTLSLRDTQLVIEGKSPSGEKDLREIYEARNHDRALRAIELWAAERPAGRVAEADALEVHRIVMADIDPANAGRFRQSRVRIGGTGFIPPSERKFDELLPRLFTLANRQHPSPVLRAAELHYNLVAVHPFVDGNGRTARLLMNFLLMAEGYPFSIISVGRRGEYLSALDEANFGRIEPFATFVLSSINQMFDLLLLD